MKTHRLRTIIIYLSILLGIASTLALLFTWQTDAHGATRKRRIKKRLATKKAPTTSPVTEKLPYTIVIGDRSADQTHVTVAVGALTTFLLPEPPLQFHSGNREALGIGESDDNASLKAIYLRPIAPVEWTNVIIEMPSGNVSFFLRAVGRDRSGAARVGTFHGEVLVKPPFYVEQLKQERARNDELFNRLQAVEKQAKEEARRAEAAIRAAEQARERGMLLARHENLVVMERATLKLQRKRFAEAERVRIGQISQMVEGTDGYWTMFEARNKSKRARSITEVEGAGLKCMLGRTGGVELQAGATKTIAVYCQGMRPPLTLAFAVDGVTLNVPLTHPPAQAPLQPVSARAQGKETADGKLN